MTWKDSMPNSGAPWWKALLVPAPNHALPPSTVVLVASHWNQISVSTILRRVTAKNGSLPIIPELLPNVPISVWKLTIYLNQASTAPANSGAFVLTLLWCCNTLIPGRYALIKPFLRIIQSISRFFRRSSLRLFMLPFFAFGLSLSLKWRLCISIQIDSESSYNSVFAGCYCLGMKL